jgi:hypothetical protein
VLGGINCSFLLQKLTEPAAGSCHEQPHALFSSLSPEIYSGSFFNSLLLWSWTPSKDQNSRKKNVHPKFKSKCQKTLEMFHQANL